MKKSNRGQLVVVLALGLATVTVACGEPLFDVTDRTPAISTPARLSSTNAPGVLPTEVLPPTRSDISVQTGTALTPVVTESGRITLSIDGIGTNQPAGYVQVEKPAGATVRRAFLAAASTGGSSYKLMNGDVWIDGTAVIWSREVPSSIYSWNHWADVTSMVKSKIDAAPAGRVTFTVTEPKTDLVDGEILAVIFDNPSAATTTNTVILLFGAQNIYGDTFNIGLAEPIDTRNPDLRLDLSLGISYSYQLESESEVWQRSIVDVNDQRLTSLAGGQDDGVPIDVGNGGLLTVGGLDDSNFNPSPYAKAPGPRGDDELYDLRPFVINGSTQIRVFTQNPSNDDNILFAALSVKGAAAIIGEGVVLGPTSSSGAVGNPHTVTATLQDDLGRPVASRRVTFVVKTGPNTGVRGEATTDASGRASFTYVGSSTAGTDEIQASFVKSNGETAFSNLATRQWINPNRPPIASCRDLLLEANATCGASGSVNNGSSDPDGDLTGCTQSPAGPYGLGITTVTLTCTDRTGLSNSCTARVQVVDRLAPTISCPADRVAECVDGRATVDTGRASASDNCGSATVNSPAPVSYPLGRSNVTHTSRDGAGNSSSCTNTVSVQDTQAPSLSPRPGSATLECGLSSYTEPGATASDACFGDLSSRIAISGTVNTQAPGSYTISYSVSDPAGHSASASRAVAVQDTQAPSLSPRPGSATLECGLSSYTEPGAIASDACFGDLSSRVATSGTVNTGAPGSYTIAYAVSDPAGHSASASRTVAVQDTQRPVISLYGGSPILVVCGRATYTEQGASALDACYGDLSASLSRSGTVNTRVPGTYTLSYSVTDPAGNITTVDRQVEVLADSNGCYHPSWSRAGQIANCGGLQAAVRLADGRVLVAGGYLPLSELYDPVASAWSRGGNMTITRRFFTLTLLGNGTALAAGGAGGKEDATAELYDPTAGTWRRTGSMSVARRDHAAVLLRDGTVLVSGGASSTITELYDSAAGTWRRTGSMVQARRLHTAALLADGKVLVAGGVDMAGNPLATAELYDPATGIWQAVGSMTQARRYHTMTVLNGGKVLVAGGALKSMANAAELYDPATRSWSRTGNMQQPRRYHTATRLLSGRVLVAGGYDEMTGIHTAAEIYDPATGTWQAVPPMHEERYRHAATLLEDGRVLVVSGFSNGDQSSTELFDSDEL